jgi:hypothetical protein
MITPLPAPRPAAPRPDPARKVTVHAFLALVDRTLDPREPAHPRAASRLIEVLLAAGLARLDSNGTGGPPATRLTLLGLTASDPGDAAALLRAWATAAVDWLAREGR